MIINKENPQTLVSYAESKGIYLLRDDIKFIKQCVNGLQNEQIRTILRRYIDEWSLGMQECESVVKRQNEGRKAANKYLREIIDAKRNCKVV
jgi:hypothetical protein